MIRHVLPVAYNPGMLADYVRGALQRAGIRPSRAKGQHFLVDEQVLGNVILAAGLTGEEYVVEIGPGLGQLTRALDERCHRLEAFELDEKITRYLEQWVLPGLRNTVVHETAFNKYELERVVAAANEAGRPLKIVTNLPYQISSAFLHTVVDFRASLQRTVVMLQREVAERVVARPGDPGYGSFSIYLQTFLEARWVCHVPAGVFYPPPRVESAVLSIAALAPEKRPQPVDEATYLWLVEGIFRHQRKQLSNALLLAAPHLEEAGVAAAVTGAGLDVLVRPEELSMADYVRLSDAVTAVETERGIHRPGAGGSTG